ncbi:hypothetical protein D3C78_1636040 [compost metagenome]
MSSACSRWLSVGERPGSSVSTLSAAKMCSSTWPALAMMLCFCTSKKSGSSRRLLTRLKPSWRLPNSRLSTEQSVVHCGLFQPLGGM